MFALICCIYKSPSVNYNDFNIELESLLNISQFNKKDVFGCGDLNMDPMKHSENRGMQEFIDIMLNAGLHRYIKTNQNNIMLLLWWWWCRPHPEREHAQDLRPPLGARPASPPTRQAAQPPPRGSSTNPRPLA